MLLTIGQVYIKEVNFTVLRDNFTIPVDKHRGIMKLVRCIRGALDHTASMHDHLMLARFLLQAFDGGTRDGLGGFFKARARAKIRPKLGESDELGDHIGGTIEELLYGSKVC